MVKIYNWRTKRTVADAQYGGFKQNPRTNKSEKCWTKGNKTYFSGNGWMESKDQSSDVDEARQILIQRSRNREAILSERELAEEPSQKSKFIYPTKEFHYMSYYSEISIQVPTGFSIDNRLTTIMWKNYRYLRYYVLIYPEASYFSANLGFLEEIGQNLPLVGDIFKIGPAISQEMFSKMLIPHPVWSNIAFPDTTDAKYKVESYKRTMWNWVNLINHVLLDAKVFGSWTWIAPVVGDYLIDIGYKIYWRT